MGSESGNVEPLQLGYTWTVVLDMDRPVLPSSLKGTRDPAKYILTSPSAASDLCS